MIHERLSSPCLLDVKNSVLKMIRFEEFIKLLSDAKCWKKEILKIWLYDALNFAFYIERISLYFACKLLSPYKN